VDEPNVCPFPTSTWLLTKSRRWLGKLRNFSASALTNRLRFRIRIAAPRCSPPRSNCTAAYS